MSGYSQVAVTLLLIGVNVLVWLVVEVATGNVNEHGFIESSLLGGTITVAHFDYALQGQFVANGEYWRLVTSGFLHYGILHLGMNMFCLWWLGGVLEPLLGRVRFLLIYSVALLGGSAGALVLDPYAFTAGASGAIFGLAGAMAVTERLSPFNRQNSGVIGFLLINVAISLVHPEISLGAHIGGLLLGALAAGTLWAFRSQRG